MRDNYYDKECYDEQKYSSYLHNHDNDQELGDYEYEEKKKYNTVSPWIIKLVLAETKSVIKTQFKEYAKKWEKETQAYSTTIHITRNDNYLDIIGMGKEVLPFILEDLKETSNYWFVALKSISKENPVPKEYFGNIEKMKEYWLEWGKQKKLI